MVRVAYPSLVAALLATTFLTNPSSAVEPSGSVVRVDPAVNATGRAGARLLEVQGAVFMGDQIVASPNGLAQIRFVDDTRLVIGPNSRLVIDKFVFNPDHTAKAVSINALKGTFRFISGNSPHQAYSIRTPTMTIGVRGTVVDINARGADSTVVFLEGSGQVCDEHRRNCVPAINDCTLHVVTRAGQVRTPGAEEACQRLAAFFPFTIAQGALDPAFRTYASSCSTDSRFNTAPPESSRSRGTPYQ
jgi:hypothetical protein